MHERTILIAGAGIAGPTLAFWLRRHGMRPVVVERAPGLRTAGQTVDVRGAGREVTRRMGLDETIRGRTTRESGIAFVDADDRPRVKIGADSFGGDGLISEIEILRGELATLLYEHTRADVEYMFGDRVTGLVDHGDRMQVSFERAPARDFDLVIAADGIGSRTRALVFETTGIHPVGLYNAYLTIPRSETDGTWARWYNATGGRSVMLRPDNLGTTRAYLAFRSPPRGHEDRPRADQIAVLRRVFADAGWETPRVLAALQDSEDFYFEAVGQVKLPTWSRGRFALVGDAAYCASPISGMGTSLAFVGAYVLAGELANHADHREAFAAYEARMRPYVDKAQKLPPGTPRLATPDTRLGIALLHTVLRVVTAPGIRRLGKWLSPPSEAVDLPKYEQ